MRVIVIKPLIEENCEKNDLNSSYRTSVHACRLCLDTDTFLYCIHKLRLADKICFLTGIMVSTSDKLPQHICRCCYFLLHKFFAFKDRSVNAQNILINAFVTGQMITTDYIRTIDRVSYKLTLPLVTTKSTVDCLNKDYAEKPVFKDIKLENISKHSQKSYSLSKTLSNVNIQGEPLFVEKLNYICSDIKEDVSTTDLQNDSTLRDADSWSNRKGLSNIENSSDTEYCDFTFDEAYLLETDDIMQESETEENNIDDEDEDVSNELSLGVDDDYVTGTDEENQSKIKHVQKVLEYSNSKSVNCRDLPSHWFECEKERIKMAKEYDVKIRLFNEKEQIERLELRKQCKHNLKRPYKCNTCFMAFKFEQPYRVHLKYHDPSRGPVKCNICHYYYPNRRHFRSHLAVHRVNFTCNKCGHVTNKWIEAKRHYHWHNGFKFKCKYCSKTFDCRSTYYMHVRLAHAALHDSCHICGEVYLGAAGLRLHFNRSHAQLLVPSAADKQFNSDDDVPERDLRSCEACGECFSDEDLFINHLKIHKRDFQCDLCEMSFVSAISLDVHKQRKHFNVVNYNVKGGGKRRRRQGVGSGHITKKRLTKDVQREVICEKCGREFKNPCSYKRHYLVHTGKRFKCDICGKELTTKLSLQYHIQSIHMGLPYPPRVKRNRQPEKRMKYIVY